VVKGAVVGALIAGITSRSSSSRHTVSNYNDSGAYNGCHGTGCGVDVPPSDNSDPTPTFDKEGNPNFDADGNYQGCHGDGCLTDDAN